MNGGGGADHRGRRFKHSPQDLEVAILQLREPPERLTVGRQWILRHPSPARELVEIHTRIDAAIECRQIHAGRCGGRAGCVGRRAP
jgi:hypothetical protein